MDKIDEAYREWRRNTGQRKKRAWRLYRSLLADEVKYKVGDYIADYSEISEDELTSSDPEMDELFQVAKPVKIIKGH